MAAYSVNLRERVLGAIERGMAHTEAVTTFRVREGSIKRWQKLRGDGHPLTPQRPGGQLPAISAAQEDEVRRLVQATPDATLQEYTDVWNDGHAPSISRWTLGCVIRRLKLTRKKRRLSRKSVTDGSA